MSWTKPPLTASNSGYITRRRKVARELWTVPGIPRPPPHHMQVVPFSCFSSWCTKHNYEAQKRHRGFDKKGHNLEHNKKHNFKASLVGGFTHLDYFSIIYGMSSFPLTNSYFSRWLLHHQPAHVCCCKLWSLVSAMFKSHAYYNLLQASYFPGYGAFLSHGGTPSSHPF